MKSFKAIYTNSFLLFAGMLLLASCKKGKAEIDFQYEYFGLTPGRFVEYDVMRVFHDASLTIKHDTTRFQVRTVVADTVIDNEGRVARKFYRYIRATSADEWQVKDLWTAIIVDNRAELVEENQRKIKLVFAPTEEKSWDCNAFNMLGEMKCHYTELNKIATIGSLSFPLTLRVEQEDYKTLIDKRRKYEVYAKGVGMISSFSQNLEYNISDPLVPRKGEELYYTITNYGMQ